MSQVIVQTPLNERLDDFDNGLRVAINNKRASAKPRINDITVEGLSTFKEELLRNSVRNMVVILCIQETHGLAISNTPKYLP